ncbi:MAG: DUF1772 domain-containing protein [Proteobacteria bacterium]|nr:DUF1772 domain-containing protein [Pseudomonadota bacterium]MBS0494067.1 DUF1772 domain-containing protein [Pseudomonadota bacterium]
MDYALSALAFVAAIGSAIIGGVFYGFSSFVMRALRRIAPRQGVAAMNSINVVVITPSFMLPFVGTALLCLVLAGGSWFWWAEVSGKLVLAAALLYLFGSFGLTMVLNQPMNLRLAALEPDQALAYWPEYVRTWTAWNHVRTAASLVATVLFFAALLTRPMAN